MARPVVHFEVIGRNPDQLRRYYPDLFDWTFDRPSPVAQEVSQVDSYGFIDLVTTDDGTGIRRGIVGGAGYDSHALFYVGVTDVEAALQRAESLGGSRVMVRPHHQMDSSWGIPGTPKALRSALRESVDSPIGRRVRPTCESPIDRATRGNPTR